MLSSNRNHCFKAEKSNKERSGTKEKEYGNIEAHLVIAAGNVAGNPMSTTRLSGRSDEEQ
jgi:hypothetical protein